MTNAIFTAETNGNQFPWWFAATDVLDHHFDADAWLKSPFCHDAQAFLLQQRLWKSTTSGVTGVSRHHEHVISFVGKQTLDMMSPANFLVTNPLVLDATVKGSGQNLLQGTQNDLENKALTAGNGPPVGSDAYIAGAMVAVTPGSVAFRNHPIELIHDAPTTEGTQFVDPDTWRASTPVKEGSWWPVWVAWLGRQATNQVNARQPGSPLNGYPTLEAAPGSDVLHR